MSDKNGKNEQTDKNGAEKVVNAELIVPDAATAAMSARRNAMTAAAADGELGIYERAALMLMAGGHAKVDIWEALHPTKKVANKYVAATNFFNHPRMQGALSAVSTENKQRLNVALGDFIDLVQGQLEDLKKKKENGGEVSERAIVQLGAAMRHAREVAYGNESGRVEIKVGILAGVGAADIDNRRRHVGEVSVEPGDWGWRPDGGGGGQMVHLDSFRLGEDSARAAAGWEVRCPAALAWDPKSGGRCCVEWQNMGKGDGDIAKEFPQLFPPPPNGNGKPATDEGA